MVKFNGIVNPQQSEHSIALRKSIRRYIIFFITALALSGVTAFPIASQLRLAHQWIYTLKWDNFFFEWIEFVYEGVEDTYGKYPFIAYGTDWLAFAHLVIAIVFIGPLRDPVKNIWVIEFGMIACVAIIPLAVIAGEIRGIPFYWQMIDCSFGIIGGMVLWKCYRKIKLLEKVVHFNYETST